MGQSRRFVDATWTFRFTLDSGSFLASSRRSLAPSPATGTGVDGAQRDFWLQVALCVG